MRVTFYGTRGSCPVSSPAKVGYGGNTTCLRIESECLPAGTWLVVDAGTGIVPLSDDFLKGGGKAVGIVITHYHHDHTQGLPLSAFPYLAHVPVRIFGPVEHDIGPKEVLRALMRSPFFPVDAKEIAHHIQFQGLEYPNATVMAVHKEGRYKCLALEEFNRLTAAERQIPFRGGSFEASECLVVKMFRSNHPEQTISYRFEERPTGKVFTFVTDHENQDGLPLRFRDHLVGSSLLVMDCQYNRKKYDTMTAGWGHATPDYVARVARDVGVSQLGLTHHDPFSSDGDVDEIVGTATSLLSDTGITVFGCRDYQVVDV